jgi:hypothetical protein
MMLTGRLASRVCVYLRVISCFADGFARADLTAVGFANGEGLANADGLFLGVLEGYPLLCGVGGLLDAAAGGLLGDGLGDDRGEYEFVEGEDGGGRACRSKGCRGGTLCGSGWLLPKY